MISCPKCGFNQPPDEFCANCGINMVRFRPSQKPFLIRLKENRWARALGFTLVIAVGILFIKSRYWGREDSASFSTLDLGEEKNAPNIDLPVRALHPPQNATESILEKSKPAPNLTPPSLSKEKESIVSIPETLKVQVIFLEVPMTAFETQLAPLVKFAGSGQIRGGTFNQIPENLFKESKELSQQFHSLQKKEIWDLVINPNKANKESQEFGFSLQMENTDVAENQYSVQFSYLSHLPIYAERKIAAVESGEFTQAVKFPPTGGFFIAGGLSRRSINEEDPLTGGPFDILNSELFKEGESEFVIVILSKP